MKSPTWCVQRIADDGGDGLADALAQGWEPFAVMSVPAVSTWPIVYLRRPAVRVTRARRAERAPRRPA